MTQTVQCQECEEIINVTDLQYNLSVVLLVEFSSSMISASNFSESVTVFQTEYTLVALVRHLGSHFTCAIHKRTTTDNAWILIDDLSDRASSFDTLNELYAQCTSGCFLVFISNILFYRIVIHHRSMQQLAICLYQWM